MLVRRRRHQLYSYRRSNGIQVAQEHNREKTRATTEPAPKVRSTMRRATDAHREGKAVCLVYTPSNFS